MKELYDYDPDAPLETRVRFLTQQLLARDDVMRWKRLLQQELSRPEVSLEQLSQHTALVAVLERMGIASALRRVVVDLHCEATREVQAARAQQATDEEKGLLPEQARAGPSAHALDVVLRAKETWERVTREELLRFAREQGKPLVAASTNPVRSARKDSSSADAASGGSDSSVVAALPVDPEPKRSYKPPPSTRFLYDANDLLHTLQSIEPPNRARSTAPALPELGSIRLQFATPSASELRLRYAELAPSVAQIGVDDAFPSERQAAFVAEKLRVGDAVVSHRSAAMARQFAKTGCPASLRPALWQLALLAPSSSSSSSCSSADAASRQYFQQLQEQVARWTYVTDDMYLLDLQHAIDHADYFVFQDLLDSVVLAFTRDPHVQRAAERINGAVETELPSISGLVLYAAPLTYLFTDDVALYFVFREMYVRYWSRLNAIASAPERCSLLSLCQLFERLVQRSSPRAVFRLLDVGIKPLDVAFPWLQGAFSGVLEIQQLLLLWDRVVGYDSIEVLAVAAAALFHFRADELATSGVARLEDARALFAELLDVRIVPLLQEYLFLVT
ncbi:hypothetical protein PINS_up008000 [Pythium insidiosum]|nr:hypothetical protein PINS_up008000 [Pythium insidiosum]